MADNDVLTELVMIIMEPYMVLLGVINVPPQLNYNLVLLIPSENLTDDTEYHWQVTAATESRDPDLYDELSYTLNYGLDPSNMTSVIQQSQSSNNIISEEEIIRLDLDGVDDFVSFNHPVTSNNGIVEFIHILYKR